MLGDSLKHTPQISFRIDVIQLGRADQAVDHGRALKSAARVGVGFWNVMERPTGERCF